MDTILVSFVVISVGVFLVCLFVFSVCFLVSCKICRRYQRRCCECSSYESLWWDGGVFVNAVVINVVLLKIVLNFVIVNNVVVCCCRECCCRECCCECFHECGCCVGCCCECSICKFCYCVLVLWILWNEISALSQTCVSFPVNINDKVKPYSVVLTELHFNCVRLF